MSASAPDVTRVQSVDPCPHCGARHDFVLGFARERRELVFAGPGTAVAVTCPTTGLPVNLRVEVPDGEKYLGQVGIAGAGNASGVAAPDPATATSAAGAPAATAPPPEQDDDGLAEWRTESRTQATDYCGAMLTACLAAIPVFFAVFAFAVGAHPHGGVLVAAGTPPLVLLIAAGVFAAALRPRLREVTRSTFAEVRDARIRQLDRAMRLGSALFALAIVVAGVVVLVGLGSR